MANVIESNESDNRAKRTKQVYGKPRSPKRTMMMQKKWMNRLASAVVMLGLLAACEKHDAEAGQAVLNNVASQAGQKFDQAASYVGQQADSVKQSAQQNLQSAGTLPDLSASGVVATARANMDGAASSANAAIANAASDTGAGLQTAGRKLQEWSASGTSTGQSASSTVSGTDSGRSSSASSASSDPGNARTDMDK
jgi:hypothetical protein